MIPPDTPDDAAADAVIAFLRSEGAGGLRHAGGRTLLDHLLGTYAIVRRWDQPAWLQHAALIHSVYGTESYDRRLISPERRNELVAVGGSSTRAPGLPVLRHASAPAVRRHAPVGARCPQALCGRLRGGDGRRSTDEGRARCSRAPAHGEHGRAGPGSRRIARPVARADSRPRRAARGQRHDRATAVHCAAGDTVGGGRGARSTGVSRGPRGRSGRGHGWWASERMHGLALAAAVPRRARTLRLACSPVALRGDDRSSKLWTGHARRRAVALGAPWDKRLTFEDWLAIIDALELAADRDDAGHAGDHAAARAARVDRPSCGFRTVDRRRAGAATGTLVAPDAADGRRRFQRYIESLAASDGPPSGAVYPDLASRAWHDPRRVSAGRLPRVQLPGDSRRDPRPRAGALSSRERAHRPNRRVGRRVHVRARTPS